MLDAWDLWMKGKTKRNECTHTHPGTRVHAHTPAHAIIEITVNIPYLMNASFQHTNADHSNWIL